MILVEPSLFVDSCLCDFCWKYLEKTYKYNKSKNRKEEPGKKSRLLEGYVKKNISRNQNQARKCSIHLCSRLYSHKMSVKECEHLKKLFLTFESYNVSKLNVLYNKLNRLIIIYFYFS